MARGGREKASQRLNPESRRCPLRYLRGRFFIICPIFVRYGVHKSLREWVETVFEEQGFNRPEKFRLTLGYACPFENKQDHTEKVLPLKSFSILRPNLSSLSVRSQRALILWSLTMKLQSGRRRSFVIRYVLWDDVNTWQSSPKSSLHTSKDSLKW